MQPRLRMLGEASGTGLVSRFARRAEPMVPLRMTRSLAAGMPRRRIEAPTAALTAMTRVPSPMRMALFSNSL